MNESEGTILKFGKYNGKSIEDVVKSDIDYIYYLYTSAISRVGKLDHDLIGKLEDAIRDNPLKKVESLSFGKYKGKPIEEVFKKDFGYLGYILKEEQNKPGIKNNALIKTIKDLIMANFEQDMKEKNNF